MKKRSRKEWIVRLALMLAGLLAVQLGTAFALLTGLGADPFQVLIQGVAKQCAVSQGVAYLYVCLGLLLVLSLISRGCAGPGTFLCALAGGPILDGCLWLFGGVITDGMYLPVRILILSAACILAAFGSAVLVQSDTGEQPSELPAHVLSQKLQKRRNPVVLGTDAVMTAAGVLCGGIFGIGTLMLVFVADIAAGYFMPAGAQLVRTAVAHSCRAGEEEED